MKALKRFSWSPDGIETFPVAPGESIPGVMPDDMVQQLIDAGYITEDDPSLAFEDVDENEDADEIEDFEDADEIEDFEDEDFEDEDSDETEDSDEDEIPENYDQLPADEMKILALRVTGKSFTTKTAARKAIAEHQRETSEQL